MLLIFSAQYVPFMDESAPPAPSGSFVHPGAEVASPPSGYVAGGPRRDFDRTAAARVAAAHTASGRKPLPAPGAGRRGRRRRTRDRRTVDVRQVEALWPAFRASEPSRDLPSACCCRPAVACRLHQTAPPAKSSGSASARSDGASIGSSSESPPASSWRSLTFPAASSLSSSPASPSSFRSCSPRGGGSRSRRGRCRRGRPGSRGRRAGNPLRPRRRQAPGSIAGPDRSSRSPCVDATSARRLRHPAMTVVTLGLHLDLAAGRLARPRPLHRLRWLNRKPQRCFAG